MDGTLHGTGLTKNWRYPGWRTTWVLGPRSVIEAVTSSGSFLDGGGSRPLQRAAIYHDVFGRVPDDPVGRFPLTC